MFVYQVDQNQVQIMLLRILPRLMKYLYERHLHYKLHTGIIPEFGASVELSAFGGRAPLRSAGHGMVQGGMRFAGIARWWGEAWRRHGHGVC